MHYTHHLLTNVYSWHPKSAGTKIWSFVEVFNEFATVRGICEVSPPPTASGQISINTWYTKCAMVKSRYIGDGHPTFNRNPYNGYINPYYWVDDHPLLYGNSGSLDPGTNADPISANLEGDGVCSAAAFSTRWRSGLDLIKVQCSHATPNLEITQVNPLSCQAVCLGTSPSASRSWASWTPGLPKKLPPWNGWSMIQISTSKSYSEVSSKSRFLWITPAYICLCCFNNRFVHQNESSYPIISPPPGASDTPPDTPQLKPQVLQQAFHQPPLLTSGQPPSAACWPWGCSSTSPDMATFNILSNPITASLCWGCITSKHPTGPTP